MNIQEIANKLVDHCRNHTWEAAHNELYAENCISLEPATAPMPRVEGMAGIAQKRAQFSQMVQSYNCVTVSEPLVSEPFISLKMKLDCVATGGHPMVMEELCMYEVKDGKIISEQFFYPAPPQPPQG